MNARKKELEAQIERFEKDIDDYEDQYCEALNDYGQIKIGSLTFYPADIIRELDSTAYRCGLIDYVDSLDKEDDEKYKALIEELEEIENNE